MVNPISVEKEEVEGGNNTLPPECGARDGDNDGDVLPLHSDIVVPGDTYRVNITGLEPGTTYVFCVGYSSGKFMSDWSASQELITLDGELNLYTSFTRTRLGPAPTCLRYRPSPGWVVA